MIDKKLLERYADISITMKGLEAEQEELKAHIVGAMSEADTRIVETKKGKFTLVSRPTYTFSKVVEGAEKALKALKDEEKESGLAKSQTTESLSFRAIK